MSTRCPSARTAALAVFTRPRGPRRCGQWSGAAPRCPPAPTASPGGDARGSAALLSVLAPHVTAAGAAVAAWTDQQRRGAPPEGLVRQTTRQRVLGMPSHRAAAPPVRFHRLGGTTIRLEPLPDGFEAELRHAASNPGPGADEGSIQASRSSGRVAWEPPSSEDLDPYPANDAPTPLYLECEEPATHLRRASGGPARRHKILEGIRWIPF